MLKTHFFRDDYCRRLVVFQNLQREHSLPILKDLIFLADVVSLRIQIPSLSGASGKRSLQNNQRLVVRTDRSLHLPLGEDVLGHSYVRPAYLLDEQVPPVGYRGKLLAITDGHVTQKLVTVDSPFSALVDGYRHRNQCVGRRLYVLGEAVHARLRMSLRIHVPHHVAAILTSSPDRRYQVVLGREVCGWFVVRKRARHGIVIGWNR
jgi:hypothetical protein